MGQGRSLYRFSVGKTCGKEATGEARHRWEDNITMDLEEVGCVGMELIELAQDRVSLRALLNEIINLLVP
jgi:hypothetical protein